jgi:DNA-binding CsgD family transcriptional regulator
MAVSREARIEAVKLMIERGWSPPAPNSRQLERILDDLAHVAVNATLELSPMDTRVLSHAMLGYSEQESADELGMKYDTLRDHRKRIRDRLGAKNMAHATALYFKPGLLAA